MKRSAVVFLLLLFKILPVAAQTGEFTIQGTVDTSLKITTLYFSQTTFLNGRIPKSIKVPVQNGRFIIHGTLAEPSPGFISTAENLQPKNKDDIRQFVLDKGLIHIRINDVVSGALISGSAANDDISRFSAGQASYMAKLTALNEAAETQSRRGIPLDSIIRMYHRPLKEAGKELTDYQREFVRSNPDAFISLLLIPELAKANYDYFAAEKLLRKLDNRIQTTPSGQAIMKYIESEKKMSVGAIAPEFTSADTLGKPVALSSLKGKYVLIDFWAAWCGPCRQENPNVVAAYQKFRSQGFTVFGVSLDRDKKDWLKAIHKDGLTWPHVSDLKHFESPSAVLYRVGSIPRNFLIDPSGKIIARDLRGPDLHEKLAEVFKIR